MRKDPHSYCDNEQGQITHLDIHFVVDFGSKTIDASVDYTIKDHDTDYLDLDTNNLEIILISSKNGEEVEYELADKEPILGRRLRIFLPPGSHTFFIAYRVLPGSDALQWLEPSQTFGKRYPFLYSQGQAIATRSFIPLQDTPGVRFTYCATITAPSYLKVLMAAKHELTYKETNYLQHISIFSMDNPIPSYLLAFAVGNIAEMRMSDRCVIYAEPEIIAEALWEFENLEQILQKGEEILGEYLWEEYRILFLPPAFPFGGMENTTLSFISPTVISGDRSQVSVVYHELAHSWTGNLVTNNTWESFWLNEGFTMFAELAIQEALEGKEAVALSETLGYIELTEDIAWLGADNNLTRLHPNLEGIDPDDVFSSVPYWKGYFFLKLLSQLAGRDRFMQFLKEYIEEFAFKPIDSYIFLEFLEEKLPGIAKKARAQEWIFKPGLPNNIPYETSKEISMVMCLAQNWSCYGLTLRPNVQESKKWKPLMWVLYLKNLPTLTTEDCAWLDQTCGLSQMRHIDIREAWLIKGIQSSYEPIWLEVEDFLSTVGRMVYLRHIYAAIMKVGRKDLAEQLYERYKNLYHPMAQSYIENDMQNYQS